MKQLQVKKSIKHVNNKLINYRRDSENIYTTNENKYRSRIGTNTKMISTIYNTNKLNI